MDNLTPVIVGAAFTFVFGLLGIIYTSLNKKAEENGKKIESVKEGVVTLEAFDRYKTEHNREHDKQDKAYEKLDKKLDRIIQMLLEGRHEK